VHPRIFLLSPANCTGRRAALMIAPSAEFPLARQLQAPGGAPIGEVFSFVSGLYFRGKLAYARRFARPPEGAVESSGGVLIITPNAGLMAAEGVVTLEAFLAFAGTAVDQANEQYRVPLERGARALLDVVGQACDVVLLGSIASGKYVEVLEPIFGRRLLFPSSFVGRGDMSRGGLMLRCAAAGTELEYVPVAGAERHGQRPPKLGPRRTVELNPASHSSAGGGGCRHEAGGMSPPVRSGRRLC
jgi:hypothetical protein